MHRLFVALKPPPAIVDACFDAMEDGPLGWAWQDEDQLHVTVRFIGDVDRHHAEDIAQEFQSLRAPTVQIGLTGVGWFDHGPRGTLFARAGPKPPLDALHAKVDRLLVRLGHEPERRAYLPHITLARRRSRAEPPDLWLRARADLSTLPEPVLALTLYESRLGRGGATYQTVLDVPLNG